MPKVMIWVRKKDLDKWKQIENKPEFISDAINLAFTYKDHKLPVHFMNLHKKDLKSNIKVEVKKSLPIVDSDRFAPLALKKAEENGVCKTHGTPLTAGGKCLQKGCKYA